MCMQFVNKHRSRQTYVLDWVKELLKALMTTIQLEQRETLLNGYARLYQLAIYVLPYNDQGLMENLRIERYTGDSLAKGTPDNHPEMAFILNDPLNCSFTPLFIINEFGIQQTCFPIDDGQMLDHIRRSLADQKSQRKYAEDHPEASFLLFRRD